MIFAALLAAFDRSEYIRIPTLANYETELAGVLVEFDSFKTDKSRNF